MSGLLAISKEFTSGTLIFLHACLDPEAFLTSDASFEHAYQTRRPSLDRDTRASSPSVRKRPFPIGPERTHSQYFANQDSSAYPLR